MQPTDFSKPIRQSSKGIVIIFLFNTFKFFKRFFVFFVAIGVSLSKKDVFARVTLQKVILIICGVLVLLLVFAILKYLNFKFSLSKDDFRLSTGILNKDAIVIPKTKIQNVYIKQNFMQQLINVVSLNIETAGDNKSEIEISALDKSTALQLKKELFNKRSLENTQVLEEKLVFFKVSFKRLLLEGISQNHLKSFVVIASFVFGIYYEFKDYVNNLRLKQYIEDFIHLDQESSFNLIIINLFFIGLAILISLLFSVIKTVIVNFNLEVVDNEEAIEINKGLFNKVSLSLAPSRIQNLVIKTNRLKQYFGLHTLSVKQAMVNLKQRKNFEIIALEKNQLCHLVDKLLVDYNREGDYLKPRPYYKRILTLDMLILFVVINIPGILILGHSMWWFNVFLFVVAIAYIQISYRKAYYNIDDKFITTGSGFIDSTTNILEIHKIQSVKLKQSIFQKRYQIISVIVTTASKSVKIPYVTEKQAKLIYDYLLFKLESQPKDWM